MSKNPFSTITPVKLVLAFATLASLPYSPLAAGPAPVDLRSTARFAILSGAAITSTGGGIINGDVGASPITGGAIGVTAAQVFGTIYTVDAAGPPGSVMNPTLLNIAKGDLTTAFNDARDREPVPSGNFRNPGAGNIGGMTLPPGLYKFDATASITGSDVTLQGGPDDVWIFQVASDLQVGTSIRVLLAGGAVARNVFWQVGSIATIGTFAEFKGTILASQSIVMGTSSKLDGRALAFTAGVTFNANSGARPMPKAPNFTTISKTNSSAVVAVNTSPYFLLTLQSTPTLSPPIVWSTVATNTPASSLWSITNNIGATNTLFYRAFLTP
jgi:hypothetical protein